MSLVIHEVEPTPAAGSPNEIRSGCRRTASSTGDWRLTPLDEPFTGAGIDPALRQHSRGARDAHLGALAGSLLAAS